MAVQTQFVSALTGQWIQLCELRDTRDSLRIQSLESALIICNRTDGPIVGSVYGPIPAGFWQSIDTGIGPTQFTLSESLDGDLVKQSWFGWLLPLPPPVPPPPITPPGIFSIGNPATANITLAQSSLVIVQAMTATTAPVLPICVSSLMGVIAPFAQVTLPDGLGDSAIMVLFAWIDPPGTDVITISTGTPDALVGLVMFGPGVALDVFGVGSAAGTGSMLLTASGPTAGPLEVAVAATVFFDSSFAEFWPSPWVNTQNLAFVSPSGTNWGSGLSYMQNTIVWTPAVVVQYAGAQTSAGIIAAFTFPAAPTGQQLTVTVSESFEIIQPQKPKLFPVQLPKLSPDAIVALRDLIQRVQAAQGDE